MPRSRSFAFLVLAVLVLGGGADTRAAEVHPQLAGLSAFVGKTWRGEFANSTPENPVVDVQHWEWALNGQAIRILHSVNDGAYGGESILMWDRERERLIYFYFTTAGFYTTGTIVHDEGAIVAHEEVTGSLDGVTAVRSTSILLEDGRLHTQAEYLKEGSWVPGHEIKYVEDSTAKVVFR
jgi:hypothetical protein